MSKLNMKVIDMETPMLDATKKVQAFSHHHPLYSTSMRPLRIIVRRDSSQIKSRRIWINNMVSIKREI